MEKKKFITFPFIVLLIAVLISGCGIIYTDIKTVSSPIEKVEFYYDDKLELTDNNIPYIWHLNKISIGKHKIKAIVYDTRGRNSTDQISFLFINPLR